jgi:protein-tyrosine-phosphatase
LLATTVFNPTGRVLVVCVSNAGRSQIAQAFLEKCSPSSEITSAGTDVGAEGEERDGFPLRPDIIAEASKVGLDLRGRKRARLVKNLADWANDIIVIMTDEETKRHLPIWFDMYEHKASYWPVEDTARVKEGGKLPTQEQIASMIEEIERLSRAWCEEKARA